jgi:hypothetical protein
MRPTKYCIAFVGLTTAGLIVAQIAAAGPAAAQSQLGPPTTPGMRSPEQTLNQELVTPTPPPTMARQGGPAGPPAAVFPGDGAASSPGLSFGAAPPPIVSPNR